VENSVSAGVFNNVCPVIILSEAKIAFYLFTGFNIMAGCNY
jgi:hypothetical protein